MAKRLTASEKWEDPWFFALPAKDKIFWLYLLDKCNHAGIWQVNWPLVQFHIKGFRFAHKTYEGRILEVSESKWFIPKFIAFQYGTLNPSNRVHASVLRELEKEGASEGLASPMLGAKDKDKDKEKEKDMVKEKVKVKDVDVAKARFEDFVFLTDLEYGKLCKSIGEKVQDYIVRLNGYIGQIGQEVAAKKYRSHYHTILNWHRKDVAEGKHGTNDSKGAYSISSPKERIGPSGKTPAELRAILDREISKEFSPWIRDHAMAAPDQRKESPMDNRSAEPNGERK